MQGGPDLHAAAPAGRPRLKPRTRRRSCLFQPQDFGFYNAERSHSARAGRTPKQAYRDGPPLDMMDKPPRVRPTSARAPRAATRGSSEVDSGGMTRLHDPPAGRSPSAGEGPSSAAAALPLRRVEARSCLREAGASLRRRQVGGREARSATGIRLEPGRQAVQRFRITSDAPPQFCLGRLTQGLEKIGQGSFPSIHCEARIRPPRIFRCLTPHCCVIAPENGRKSLGATPSRKWRAASCNC